MSVSLDLRVTTSTQDGTTTSMDVGDEGEASAGEDLHYKTTESLMRITRAVVSLEGASARSTFTVGKSPWIGRNGE